MSYASNVTNKTTKMIWLTLSFDLIGTKFFLLVISDLFGFAHPFYRAKDKRSLTDILRVLSKMWS